ncbi:GNAT family N-acetyltransferase [Lutispora thermophila]|uniref:Protein N-acetyltransferase, RimJ/RimL family n=1 Tax=Lutispora thermophila DSM 19022 TaxID=1122184 RepID=A0A1M6EHW6_9FIRM|nr:GNAT family N-acetyltransferase [Lutispora thermophila]SHI84989.1 Protein N-acetyltransferase, RimJ/RimL family [Lutispora thermophila DSM 19022]
MREFFMKTKRIGFSRWNSADLDLATQLWGDKEVTRFICATGVFTRQDIIDRLYVEIHNDKMFNIQYWPIFDLSTEDLIGCCGIRPFNSEIHSYEIGFHLRKKYWGMGYALEAAKAVIDYSFNNLKADKLYAGHHPQNEDSKKLLTKLGFRYIGENYYNPTGLYHPSYELVNDNL